MKKHAILALTLALLSSSSYAADTVNQSKPVTDYKKTDAEMKNLTPEQYDVTQKGMTEPPFQNKYWNFWQDGIYVDVVTGQPLFSSLDKYDAGNGWPAFHKPIREDFLNEKSDSSHGMERTEIRSTGGDSHLGHVFDDGPDGKRHYCVNSSSLRFIPKDKLIDEGYGEYLPLFLK